MGRSCGGGQSSLGYLFGGGDNNTNTPTAPKQSQAAASTAPTEKAPAASPSVENVINKETPAGVQGTLANNYQRTDGQNCGNFITDRPSTKVHAAPGGGSSLGYLFGGSSDGK